MLLDGRGAPRENKTVRTAMSQIAVMAFFVEMLSFQTHPDPD
jgi:hypothetical protein